jgi:hypothetical protein
VIECSAVEFNQTTMEGEEVTDSWIRTKSVTVEEKTLVVQEGMEQVLGSHRLWTIISDCNTSANKSNNPIQKPLFSVTETRTRDNITLGTAHYATFQKAVP